MNTFRKLPSFERTKPQLAVGCWVVELTFLPCFYEGMGWHGFSFGVFRIERGVNEGERMLTPHTIRGFRREYRIWLPWVRVR
jgi:hypothetical protein